MTETDRNKQLLRDLLRAADDGDMDAVESFYAPDYVDHDAGEARRDEQSHVRGTLRAFRAFRAAFPDTTHTLDDLLAEGDRVAARISAAGTHTGELPGFPATHRRFENSSIVIYRIRDGRIVERWCRERRGVLQQLREAAGAAPSAGDRRILDR
jgi:steroid delta-isomerase-like uncharacterized protein